MTSPEYQAPTWVNEDDPAFIEGVSPDLGSGYLNALSGAVEDHGQRLGAITPVVTYLNANAVTQDAGDNRWILQDNANGFAPAEATANALAGKQSLDADLTALAGLDSATAGTVASDGAGWVKKTYAQLKTALGLVKGDIGLGSVDNTSDANKPVSAATQTALDGKAARPVTVAGLTYPTVTAHRGAGAAIAPDNTMTAYQIGASYGLQVMEFGDLRPTSDGAIVCMHDTTVDRVTAASGNASEFSSAAYTAHPDLACDVDTWFPGNAFKTAGNHRTALWEEVATLYGNRFVITAEIKDAAVVPALGESLNRNRMTKSVIIQSFDSASLVALKALCPDVATCLLANAGANAAVTPANLTAWGVTWYGVATEWGSALAKIAEFKAAGFRILAYDGFRHYQYDEQIAAGADIVGSDNPLYFGRLYSKYRRTRDDFRSQTWSHGMLPLDGTPPYFGKYTWTAPNRLKFPGNLQSSLLLGTVCPIANAASSYTIDVNLTYDDLGSDITRWAGLFFACPTDHGYNDSGAATDNGYLTYLRGNGQLVIARRINGALVVGPGMTGTQTAISAGQTVPLRIQVSPTQIVVTRVDIGNTITWADTSHRGSYLHLFKTSNSGLSVSWDSLVIS